MFLYGIGAFGGHLQSTSRLPPRGLWSAIAVWLPGHWFANEEQSLTPAILRSRLTGAVLILAVIALVDLR